MSNYRKRKKEASVSLSTEKPHGNLERNALGTVLTFYGNNKELRYKIAEAMRASEEELQFYSYKTPSKIIQKWKQLCLKNVNLI